MAHAGLVLAQMLADRGVPRVFSVPGESFLAALDGLYELGIPNIVCRHEGGAAFMAEATGKLTGQPGVAFVTRGPGATNASGGVHVAMQDSTPMILFVGQIARAHRDREAFQEVDYRAMFGPLAKWVAEIDDANRLPEYVARAFHLATTGRPGPVVLALPEDMLSGPCTAPPRAPSATPARLAGRAHADRLHAFLADAERPLVVLGGSVWSQQAADDARAWAEALDLPVVAAFRRQDRMDNRSPCYAGDLAVGGNPALFARLRSADKILALGTRLGDISTGGYEALNPDGPHPAIAQVHPDPDLPGQVFRTALTLCEDLPATMAALAAYRPNTLGDWAQWRAAARQEYEAWQQPRPTIGDVRLEHCTQWLAQNLPKDAIITNGAGNYAAFTHRYHSFARYGTQLAPTSGTMGYGFPAAIAASLHRPDTPVICMAGDGCFQMTLNECATAMQFGATPIVIVANNGRYGTIRAHQERQYPGRVSGTEMTSPDFAALARSYGAHGEIVTKNDDFAPAMARAQTSGTLSIIELKLDTRMLGTSGNLPGH